MSETNFSEEVRDGLKWVDPACHISQVESPLTSAGIPDLDICLNGVEAHVELKWMGDNRMPWIKDSQVRWFRRRIRAGGTPWIFLKLDNESPPVYYLFEGKHCEALATRKDINEWHTLVHTVFVDMRSLSQWKKLVEIILT